MLPLKKIIGIVTLIKKIQEFGPGRERLLDFQAGAGEVKNETSKAYFL